MDSAQHAQLMFRRMDKSSKNPFFNVSPTRHLSALLMGESEEKQNSRTSQFFNYKVIHTEEGEEIEEFGLQEKVRTPPEIPTKDPSKERKLASTTGCMSASSAGCIPQTASSILNINSGSNLSLKAEEECVLPNILSYPLPTELALLKDMFEDQLDMLASLPIASFSSYSKRIPKQDLPKLRDMPRTLILDIDNTLLYSPAQMSSIPPSQLLFLMETQGFRRKFVLRPMLSYFLRMMYELYEIIIYTSGDMQYAEDMLESAHITPYVDHILARDSCPMLNCRLLIKEARVINRPLESLVIVDDQLLAWPNDLTNIVPITPYMAQKDDRELTRVGQYLEKIATSGLSPMQYNINNNNVATLVARKRIEYQYIKTQKLVFDTMPEMDCIPDEQDK